MDKQKVLQRLKKIVNETFNPKMQQFWIRNLIEDIEKGIYDNNSKE